MIFCVGINHKTASISVRESLFIDARELTQILPQLATAFDLVELVILSTCNRLEVYGVFPQEIGQQQAFHVFETLHQICKTKHSLDLSPFLSNIHTLFDNQAVEHIFKVAAGIESVVIGETQITGQFKSAFQQSTDLKLLGPKLGRLFQDAVSSAKRVRSETPIGQKIVSVGHCAIDLTRKVMGDASGLNYLVVGAGEMAQTLCRHLIKIKPRGLTILSRDGVSAKNLATELNFGNSASLSQLNQELAFSDCIITATRAQEYLIKLSAVEKVFAQRSGRPAVFVDISLPRNIDPSIGELDDVYLFDIDDLKQIVDGNYKSREDALTAANLIITAAVQSFFDRQKTSEISPIFEQLNIYFSKLLAKEFDRTFSKAIFLLTEEQSASVVQLKNSIAAKLTADFSQCIIKQTGKQSQDGEILRVFLQNLFSKDNL